MSGRWMPVFLLIAGYGLVTQDIEIAAIGGVMVAIIQLLFAALQVVDNDSLPFRVIDE